MNVLMVHYTLSNGDAPIYHISLTYIGRQTTYGLYKFRQLFDLGVKEQGQTNYGMMVHDTSSKGYAPIYQISLTYLERQRNYSLDKFCQLFDLGVKGQGQMIGMM